MDLIHIKITFEDTFSGAKDIKYCTRSVETFEKMKAGIGAVINTFKDHINYSWEVIKVEQSKNQKLFLYRDKTGRGIKETLTEQQLKTWKERNYDGETITEWLQECEEGDKWENAGTEIISIN